MLSNVWASVNDIFALYSYSALSLRYIMRIIY